MYAYAEGDLFRQPNTYMYPPFKGREFLESYFASRLGCMAAIFEHLKAGAPEALADWPPDADALRKEPRPARDMLLAYCAQVRRAEAAPPPGDDTAAVLRDLLGRLDEAGGLAADERFRGLVRRFEISKKLPRVLAPPRYPLGGEPLPHVEPYAHFACLLGLAAEASGDLRLLNCLLKVCDLLCSGHGQSLRTLEAGPFAALGMLQEIMLTQSLLPE